MDSILWKLLTLSSDLGYQYQITIRSGMLSLVTLHNGDSAIPYEEIILSDDDPQLFTERVETFLNNSHLKGQAAPDHRQAGPGAGNTSGRAA